MFAFAGLLFALGSTVFVFWDRRATRRAAAPQASG
jgi:hypothetical protein